MIVDEDVYLEHFGIKGMRWGVRNDEDGAKSESRFSDRQKKAAVILGSAAVVTAIGVGAIYAKKHFGVKVSDIPKSAESTKKFAEAMSTNPTSIVHSAKGKNLGFSILGKGNLDNPVRAFEEAGLGDNARSNFARIGRNADIVAARFRDPEGRLDRAGRAIEHDVILPRYLSAGVNNAEEAQARAWPFIRDIYQAFWERSLETR
jgi:hypothetical protein